MWLLARLASAFVVLIVVSAIIFALTRLAPVSPARIVLGVEATPEQISRFEAERGLDRPVIVQFGHWLADLPTEGFAKSYITGQSINELVAGSLPITLEIVALAFVVAVTGSILLGSLSAIFESTWIDHTVRIAAVAALSIPGFWLAFLLMRLFAVQLGWFPPIGVAGWSKGAWAHFSSLVLPALSISIYYVGAMSRLLRASFIEVLDADYMRTARALGLSGRTRFVYALRNALPPFVSMAAMSFGYMFGWAVVVETVFSIPGLSRALLTAIFQRDYPAIQACVIVITCAFVASNTLADILQRMLNPKLAAT